MLKNMNDPLYPIYGSFCSEYNKEKDLKSFLEGKKLFVLDMDGTFYLDGVPYERSLAFLDSLLSTGRRYLFFTNNSSKSNSFYVERLKSMGIGIGRGGTSAPAVMTSGDVAMNFLKTEYPDARVYLMGTAQLMADFAAGGINVADNADNADNVNDGNADNVDVVVCSFDMELTYDKLRKACGYIRNGSVFLATHTDYNCPVTDGFIPDCGSICALITASTGVKPRYLGKPCKEVVDAIAAETGCRADEMVIVGDRLYTDIATGFLHGVATVLVLSGETAPESIGSSREKPDIVVPFLSDLIRYL